ncbi:hypothetical protein [Inhella gelatinilytica]|uniref:hypothetical protein n=1 Tax=Inhella gelatinilytica TaxID=2795030 RepID=UPI0018DC83C4|nr:hypothetical protein [Inhella gelatinilytica]
MLSNLSGALHALFVSLLLAQPMLAACAESEARIPVAALLQDLHALKLGIANTHPDPSLTADPEGLENAFQELEAELRRGPLNRLQA